MVNLREMVRGPISTGLKRGGGVALSLSVLLFSGQFEAGTANPVMREFVSVFRDSSTQWMVFLCLGVYFFTFAFLRHRSWRGFASNSTLWLVAALVFGSVVYALQYAGSTDALVLLGGAVIGQGAAVLAQGRGERAEDRAQKAEDRGRRTEDEGQRSEVRGQRKEGRLGWTEFIVIVLLVLLVVASVWRPESIHTFEYRSRERWSGPWENPNLFGLLMAAGAMLALGLTVFSGQWSVSSKRASGAECQVSGGQNGKSWKKVDRKWRTIIGVLLCFIAVVLMGRGLLHSYSRGAWVAAVCGVGYLIYQVVGSPAFALLRRGEQVSGRDQATEIRGQKTEDSNQKVAFNFLKWRNWVSLSVVLLSVAVLCFWQFRWTEWLPARRAFSAANVNDFSWRNRINAWEGALQMMSEHPWLGVGWNQPERLYQYYYLPNRLTESAAMQMNDYLTLGATIGVPGLVCFLMYVWFSLSSLEGNSPQRRRDTEKKMGTDANPNPVSQRPRASAVNSEWVQTVCRAGAIVLAVGFWFDGGLFKLPTAATFWILLELGRADVHRGDAETRREQLNEKSTTNIAGETNFLP